MLAEAAAQLGSKHLFIVHGNDGLDEVTLTTTSFVAEVKDGTVTTQEFDPTQHGFSYCDRNALYGGDPDENATIIRAVFSERKRT